MGCTSSVNQLVQEDNEPKQTPTTGQKETPPSVKPSPASTPSGAPTTTTTIPTPVTPSTAKRSTTNVTIAGSTHIGHGDPPLKSENQDAIQFVANEFAGLPGCSYCAVLDGHGNHGRIVSTAAIEILTDIISQRLAQAVSRDEKTIKQLLKDAFLACEEQLQTDSRIGFRGKMSGTTATVALIVDGALYVAGVGDSRCILVEKDRTAVCMTDDHRPELEQEKARILKAGGVVAETGVPMVKVTSTGQITPPLRVWLKEADWKKHGLMAPGPGLMLTRSLGDQVSKLAGCIAEPEVKHVKLSSNKHWMVLLGSDGIWDVLGNEQVVEVFGSCGSDWDAGVTTAISKALDGWGALNRADNITMAVMKL